MNSTVVSREKFFFLFVFVIALFFGAVKISASEEPSLFSESYVLIEPTTGRVLYEKNREMRIFPASMTKVLTAMLVEEYLPPNELITAGSEVSSVPYDSSKSGMEEGEVITARNLIRALIIQSGNDAAAVAAVAVARKADPDADTGTYARAEGVFRKLMNEKARALGCTGSNFVNPHGYHDDNHYSTALDIGLITKAALSYPLVMETAAEQAYEGDSCSPEDQRLAEGAKIVRHKWTSHNALITNGLDYYQYATGLKTGVTDQAGECLTATAVKDGLTLISVTCNSPVFTDDNGESSPTRWSDARALFEYGFNTFRFETVQSDGADLGTVPVLNPRLGDAGEIPIYARGSYSELLSQEELERITSVTAIDASFSVIDYETGETMLKAPLAIGDVVGSVTYRLDNKEIFTADVISAGEILERNFNSDVDYYAEKTKTALFSKAALPWWIAGGLGAVVIIQFIIIIKVSSRSRRRW